MRELSVIRYAAAPHEAFGIVELEPTNAQGAAGLNLWEGIKNVYPRLVDFLLTGCTC